MLKEDTINFLRTVPPFDKLTGEELDFLSEDIVLEYYPKGVKILTQNGPAAEYLRLIKKGGVKVFVLDNDDEEIVIDLRSESEQFGLLSLISGDRSRANVLAIEDTICYLVSKEKVLKIIQSNPIVNEYFLKSFFINFIDKTHDETRSKLGGISNSDRLLFTTPVGDIVTRKPVTGSISITVQEAAGIMAENKISSLVITDEDDVPLGIITDRDLREKVVARAFDISSSVRQIMSSPLIRVDADEFCFEALLKMMRYKIHHILVVESGAFKGIVTNHDFMVLQGSSPTVLVKQIEEARDPKELAKTTQRLHKTVSALLREGARAHNITGFITELVEKLINRMLDLIEKKLGPVPVNYSVFMYGDGGRRELTLGLDVKLGFIYEDTHSPNLLKEAQKYFKLMAEELNEASAHFTMQDNIELLPLQNVKTFMEWRDTFNSWKYVASDVKPIPEFFDIRGIRGNVEDVLAMREHLYGMAHELENVLDLVAAVAVENRPPLGFFKRVVVEKSGEHRNELDLYTKGIKPLVDTVRIFSVEKGIKESSTFRRLKELGDRYNFEHSEDIGHAHDYLNTLVIHTQLQKLEEGFRPDSFINPEALASIERKTLKETFQLAATLYDILEKSYRTERAA